jgi:DNA mismatch repair ATPase MutS
LDVSIILVPTIAALLAYLEQFRIDVILKAERFTSIEHLQLSANSINQLDIEALIERLDLTKTPGGRRLFRHWMTHPLIDKQELLNRRRAATALRNWSYPVVSDLERGLSIMAELPPGN